MRTILHCDMNNFYASVECLSHPEYRQVPMAVGGDIEKRVGVILAKNYPARAYKVQTGEPVTRALKKCPQLVVVKPHFEKYVAMSRMAKQIYAQYTDQVESFGLDECWLDVTGSTRLFGSGEQIADAIRTQVREEMGLTCSVGVSFNKTFAKLGSDLKKPDATTVIPKKFQDIVWPLPVRDLLFVGRKTEAKLAALGIFTIGDLAGMELKTAKRHLGKSGVALWTAANGLDQAPVAKISEEREIKSMGNSATLPFDLTEDEGVRLILYTLSESVAARLRKHDLRAGGIQLSIRDSELQWYERQGKLQRPTQQSREIFELAYALYRRHHDKRVPIHSMGVRGFDLTGEQENQLCFLPEQAQQQRLDQLEQTIDRLREDFGKDCVRRGIVMTDDKLGRISPKEDNIVSLKYSG